MALGRDIASALDQRPSPWDTLSPGDTWVANLEGTVAEGPCLKDPAYCLGFPENALDHLAPFGALSLANNHARDHGTAGLGATIRALRARGIVPLLESQRPTVVSLAGLDMALVPVDLAATDAQLALERARLALVLARASAPWVVALPHWGTEGVAELGPGQAEVAALLHAWGADLVVGTGAHVVQPSDCELGTWYGLGNHLFDQAPPNSHEGAVLRACRVEGGLELTETRTRRQLPSPLPVPVDGVATHCVLPARPEPNLAWQAHPWRGHFRAVQPFAQGDLWLGLHERWSDIDGEVGLRPYVFRMTPQGYDEVWRGSSLARPLVAARLLQVDGEEFLCALHRGDSFLHPDPTTRERVYLVYRWNGFGFRGVDHPAALAACEKKGVGG